jgi:hypothetical protein
MLQMARIFATPSILKLAVVRIRLQLLSRPIVASDIDFRLFMDEQRTYSVVTDGLKNDKM